MFATARGIGGKWLDSVSRTMLNTRTRKRTQPILEVTLDKALASNVDELKALGP